MPTTAIPFSSTLIAYSLSSERVNRLVRTLNTIETQDKQVGPAVTNKNFMTKEVAEYQAKLAKTQAQLEAVEKQLAEAKQNNLIEHEEALLKEQEYLKRQVEIYSGAINKKNQTLESNSPIKKRK